MKSTTFYVDPLHMAIMDVLNEFKILTTELLRVEVNYKGELASFRKVLRSLMNKKVIASIREAKNRPNFLFLKKTKIDTSTLFHDFKTAEIALKLKSHPLNPIVTLAHNLDSKELIPDAILDFKKFKVFLELELSMKSETKLKKKITHYINTPSDVQIFYIFRLERDLLRYKEVIQTLMSKLNPTKRLELGERKFMLILDTEIHKEFDLKRAEVHMSGEKESLEKTLGLDKPSEDLS